jgi:DnaJ-class molecular chaperone
MENLYDILEVAKDASTEDINKSYKKLARKWHPDRHRDQKDKDEATEKFKVISEAYQILSDETKRKLYDRGGMVAVNNNESGGHGVNPFDLFSQMFGGMGGHMHSNMHDDYENVTTTVELTLEEVYMGGKHTVNVTRKNPCEKCGGVGVTNPNASKCPTCDGKGAIIRVMGNMMMQQPCHVCHQTGVNPDAEKCKKCKGKCCLEETVDIEVDIPAGWHEKCPIFVENEGHGIPEEDIPKVGREKTGLVLHIDEKEHEIFKRGFMMPEKGEVDYSDLLMILKLTFAESICGFAKTFTHLDGNHFTIKMDKSVRHDDKLIIKGKGMPVINNYGDETQKFGDLIVSVEVEHPASLDLSNGNKQRLWQILTGESMKTSDKKHKHVVDVMNIEDYIKELQEKEKKSNKGRSERDKYGRRRGNKNSGEPEDGSGEQGCKMQ